MSTKVKRLTERKEKEGKEGKQNRKLHMTNPKSKILIVNGIHTLEESGFPRNINVFGAFQQSFELVNNPAAPHGVFLFFQGQIQGIIKARHDSKEFLGSGQYINGCL